MLQSRLDNKIRMTVKFVKCDLTGLVGSRKENFVETWKWGMWGSLTVLHTICTLELYRL